MNVFELLDKIPTKRFCINGIVYNTTNVSNGRFVRVIENCANKGKLHVSWNSPEKAYIDDYGYSVSPIKEVQAREAICSGFFFDEKDIEYIKD